MLQVKCDKCGKIEKAIALDGDYGADTIKPVMIYGITYDLCNECEKELDKVISQTIKDFAKKEEEK